MEAFECERDDEDPVPSELQAIFDDSRFNSLLSQILDVSTVEGNTLIHAIADGAADVWAKHPGLVIERKRKAYGWTERFFVRRKWARSRDSIEVGFRIETNAKLGLTLYTHLWTKGGKAAAEFNARCVRETSKENVIKGSDDISGYWSNGVILLARIPLGGFVSGDELDSLRCYEHAIAQISKCTADALNKILEPRG
jgi:hypothetical protein